MKYQVERVYRLVIGNTSTGEGFEVTPPLSCSFKIEKHIDNSSKLNLATFTIINLSKESRAKFEQMKYPTIIFECGYNKADNLKTIFIGQATSIKSEARSSDIVTTIQAAEGFIQLHSVIEPFTVPQKSTVGDVINRIVKQMQGVAVGTLASNFEDELQNSIIGKGYSQKVLTKKLNTAFAAEGTPLQLFKQLCKDHKLQWRLDRNTVYFRNSVGTYESKEQDVVSLSSKTGLIGIPTHQEFRAGGSIKDLTGLVGIMATALINPDVVPGTLISISSSETDISGIYFVRHVVYEGDFRGSGWKMTLSADEIREDDE